jgi:RNA polymerase sigma-70 factor (ECF subfamily)
MAMPRPPLAPRYEFDADYVARLTAGDESTERHFTEYFGRLLAIKLRARLRSAAQIDDVIQETFLRVLTTLRSKGGLQSAGGLGAFVNSVCNNILFETYRAQTKQQNTVPDTELPLESPTASVESSLIGESERALVRRVIATLPSKDRHLLRLVFFEERDKDEICRRMGVDRQYLRVLLHRARNRFRQALAEEGAADLAAGRSETERRG